MVTRGPGATHAAGGVHTAFQDSTPLILLIGQVAREMLEREAFQEIDYRRMFGPMAKWTAQIDDAARIPELVRACLPRRDSGRPGPSCSRCRRTCWSRRLMSPTPTRYAPARGLADRPTSRERGTRSPAPSGHSSIVGGTPWNEDAHDAVMSWAEASASAGRVRLALPGLCRQHLRRFTWVISALGPDPRLAQRVREADVVLVLGDRPQRDQDGRLRLLEMPEPGAGARPRAPPIPTSWPRLQPELAIVASPAAFARRARRAAAARSRRRARRTAAGARRLPRQPRGTPRWPGDARHGRGDGDGCASACRRTRSSRTAPATSRSGRTASTSSGAMARSSRRRAARWATAFPQRWPPSSSTRSASSSASPATGTS